MNNFATDWWLVKFTPINMQEVRLPNMSIKTTFYQQHELYEHVCFPGYGLCFLLMASTPVLRSKLSKLVDPSEQGRA